ncbi:hypothetical protein J2W24_000339 [Variovorax boronicumulans]|nr:hypothetical protein [Variovorax boronicumulans]
MREYTVIELVREVLQLFWPHWLRWVAQRPYLP